MELRLRALHDLLPAAHNFPGLAVPYINFLRSLRERLHPIGVRHIRTVETASGLLFDVDLGERLGSDFYYGYLGELFEAELLLRSLEPGATLIDVGANFGYYAVSAGVRTRPDGTVFAFEPDPAAFKLLVTNVAANRLTNVRCHELCLGPEDGETDFYVMTESAFSGTVSTGRSSLLEKRTLPMRSLDSFLEEFRAAAGKEVRAEGGAGAVAAIKIDVEGSEFAVLRGGWETIRRAPEIILLIEINAKNLDAERRTALESVLQALYEDGFRGWIVDASADGIRLLADPREAAALASTNLFIVRSGSASEARLRTIARDLRLEAFPEVAGELSLGSEVLYGNAEEPRYTLNLREALIGTALHNREGEIDALSARLAAAERDGQIYREELENRQKEIELLRDRLIAVEEDSQARLEELQRRGAEATGLREQLEAVERDSQARLEELERRGPQFDAMRTSLEAVEQESRARLEGLRQQEAEVEALRDRQEATEQDSHARLEELKQRSDEARALREQLEAVERDSQARREELEKRGVEVQALQARVGTLEDDNHARLAEMERLSVEMQSLNAQLRNANDQLRNLTDQLRTTEQHEEAARHELHETEEKLRRAMEEHERITHAFQAEVEAWKREAQLGIAQRVWRSVRRALG